METPELTEIESLLLAAIPAGGSEARHLRSVPGLSPQRRSRLLARLEAMGLAERWPNGWGPEQPWWWMRLPRPPAEPVEPPVTEKGTVYDRFDSNGSRVHFECDGTVNEFGCVSGYLKAGENNSRRTVVPPHLLLDGRWWTRRKRGPVTTWSAGFYCPVHGECSEDMVRTDKNCALCGTGLIRL